jgi:transcriptional regulator with PAS, ATPase and Fis domain
LATDRFADPGNDMIVARSKSMLRALAQLDRLATRPIDVCIVGETGTGKELAARAIHRRSARRHRPFVTIDVTTIPEGLFESALFGHVRGAFTGAVGENQGLVAQADGGTLFLDEIGDLPLHLQAKLLRVIQAREFVRVGGTRPIRSDFRLVTATRRDLSAAVEHGQFREDLYYRVAVATIALPPLRERRDDIPLLIDHFLARLAAAHGKPPLSVSPRALRLLCEHRWPGNVRQLAHCLEQAVVLADGPTIDVDLLAIGPARSAPPSTTPTWRWAST